MIIAIVGPTGIGKSKLALKIAQEVKGEIVNCDAFQIYKEMDIGTAKPSLEERSLVPHHLFDYVEPTTSFSVYDYQVSLRNKIEELQLEIMKKDIEIARLKKGYTVKGVGAEKEFVTTFNKNIK